MNYNKMSFISGIVIFFSIIILLVSVITLSGKRIFFTRDYVIYVKFDDVIGLQDQAKVFMRGYRIGWIKDVQFEKDAVLVRVDINKKYRVPADSKIEINTISLLGEKAVTIHPGVSGEYIQPRSIVRGENKDIMIQAKELLSMLKTSIAEGDFKDKAKKLSRSIDTFHDLLLTTNAKVQQLDIQQYNNDIHQLGEAGRTAQVVLGKTSDSLQTRLKSFDRAVDNFDRLSRELTVIARKINNGDGSAGALVNNKEYVENLNKTLAQLNELIVDFKKNPKRYIDLSIF